MTKCSFLSVPTVTIYSFDKEEYDWVFSALNVAIERDPQNVNLYRFRAELFDKRGEFRNELADRDILIKYARTDAEKARAHNDRSYTH